MPLLVEIFAVLLRSSALLRDFRFVGMSVRDGCNCRLGIAALSVSRLAFINQ